MKKVTLDMIKEARETIKDVIKETALLESVKMSEKTGANIFLKCENLQKTGSFKIRGACNKIANLTDEEKAKGVIASSAGNHAQGVALGAKMNGIKATIVMPSTAPLAKVTATKGYGAEVVLEGLVYDDAYAKAIEIQKETGATFLHPFNDEYVIAGQGTISLEILEQLENVDTIVCPIGGGGIISGVATAAKALKPSIKIVGVQTSNIPSMKESLEKGEVTSAFKDVTIADGIAVKTPGDLTFSIIKDLIDEIIVVDEDEIAQAMLFLLENQKVTSEGSGAVSTAAIWSGKYIPKKDEIVYLRENSNISTGGDSVDYTDDIPQKFKEIAVNAARAAGAKICGVDMMLEDYSDENTNYAIIELNFNPAIHIHSYPYKGKERNIAKHVLKLLELI